MIVSLYFDLFTIISIFILTLIGSIRFFKVGVADNFITDLSNNIAAGLLFWAFLLAHFFWIIVYFWAYNKMSWYDIGLPTSVYANIFLVNACKLVFFIAFILAILLPSYGAYAVIRATYRKINHRHFDLFED